MQEAEKRERESRWHFWVKVKSGKMMKLWDSTSLMKPLERDAFPSFRQHLAIDMEIEKLSSASKVNTLWWRKNSVKFITCLKKYLWCRRCLGNFKGDENLDMDEIFFSNCILPSQQQKESIYIPIISFHWNVLWMNDLTISVNILGIFWE